MTPGGCAMCAVQRELLAALGDEDDMVGLSAIEGWHLLGHEAPAPITVADPVGPGWAGKTARADTVALADLAIAPDEELCTACWLVHRPGRCDR